MRRATVLSLAALALPGCGETTRAPTREAPVTTPATPPSTASTPLPAPTLEPARCAADAPPNCAAVTGRVLLVESVDPDGDGDLHVVVRGGSVTGPGVSILDVSAALRPTRDPRVGDRVTGAGPVFRGSVGQKQVQVTTFRVARATGRGRRDG